MASMTRLDRTGWTAGQRVGLVVGGIDTHKDLHTGCGD